MNPVSFLLILLPLIIVDVGQARTIPESTSPLHRRLARSEVYQVNALTDDIPAGLRAEFTEEDVNDTVQEVQKLLEEDPTLPRLTRAEILALFDNVTRSEKQTKESVKTTRENSQSNENNSQFVATSSDEKSTDAKYVPESNTKRDQSIYESTTENKSTSVDEPITNKNFVRNHESVTDSTRSTEAEYSKEETKYTTEKNLQQQSGVYVVLPEKVDQSTTQVYFKNTGSYEIFDSQTEEVSHQNFDESSTENSADESTSTEHITSKPNRDEFNIDIDKLSELTRSSFEDTRNTDVLNVNLEPSEENSDENKMSTFSQQGIIRYYNNPSSEENRHTNHKYSAEEDKAADDIILDTILNQKRPVYITTTPKPKPRIESTGRPFSVPTTGAPRVKFQPVAQTTPSTTTTEKVTTLKPDTATIKIPYTIQPYERLTLASIRPETYARFRPLPKPEDATLSKDMESFLAEFGLVPSTSQNRANRKLVTPAPKKAPQTNTHVFNPANSTRVSLQKLTQLLDAVKQLENLDGTLTTKDLDKIADKLEALGIGTRNDGFSNLSLGPNPLSDKYHVDSNKNEIKRQQPNGTEESLKFDLLLKNSTLFDQETEQTEPKVVNAAPSTTSTTTTERPVDLLALEESFGAPIDPATIDEELPPPRKNGLYFLADWNSFLEVGEDNKDKVVIRFNPKVGDASRFLPVTVP